METENIKPQNEPPKALTFIQQIALKGEVATCYEKALHQADMLYSSFVLLYSTDEEYRPYYIEEMLEYISTEDLTKINRYVVNDMFPTSLYVDKFIADIRCFLGNTSCNLKDRYVIIPEAAIRSKFANFTRMLGHIVPSVVTEIINAILLNETGDLGFLQDIAFSSLVELQGKEDIAKDTLSKAKYLQCTLADVPLISFIRETATLEQSTDMADTTLEKIVDDVITENRKTEIKKTYVVYKKDKVTNNSTPLGEFPTQAKALEYMKGISKDYPELLKRYELTVVTVVEKGE